VTWSIVAKPFGLSDGTPSPTFSKSGAKPGYDPRLSMNRNVTSSSGVAIENVRK
jgi:hypothetical protein